MLFRTNSRVVLAAALFAALACGRRDDATKVDTATGTVTPTPTTAPLAVGEIDVGRSLNADKGIADRTNTFRKTDTIYVSVATAGAGSGTLAARWTFQDGQVVDESTQSISPTGPARTEFHVSKPGGWPVGRYKVEILLNGASAGSKEFEVR